VPLVPLLPYVPLVPDKPANISSSILSTPNVVILFFK
jgi:hypothetical protein